MSFNSITMKTSEIKCFAILTKLKCLQVTKAKFLLGVDLAL